jgi:uncharacterized protein (TIGR03435 family)
MTSQFIVNHLWQSSCFAVLAGFLAFVLRKNSAKVRYWVWLSASLKFLVPFALLASLGTMIPRPTRTPASAVAPVFLDTFFQVAEPLSPTFDATVPAHAPVAWAPTAISMWALGFLAIALARCRSWIAVRSGLRAGVPIELPIPVRALITPGAEEPGIVGFLRPVLVLPARLLEHLNDRQLSAILTHEMCHVRRRDNFFAAVHMVVEAIFWFHPLVWWIGSRMVEERELACDEEVLRMGCDPTDYIEGILKVCRFYTESPLPCVSGVTSADVKKRLRAILAGSIARELTTGRKVALAAIGLITLAAPIVIGVLSPPSIRAQSQQSTVDRAVPTPVKPSTAPQIVAQQSVTQAAPAATATAQIPGDASEVAARVKKFEVASIKPCAEPGGGGAGRGGGAGGAGPSPGRLRTNCQTVAGLINTAYVRFESGQRNGPRNVPLSGGPAWITSSSERYEINATAEGTPSPEVMQGPMLQALLEDRFKLKIHRETRNIPVYAMTVAKGGPKLQASATGSCNPEGPRPSNPREAELAAAKLVPGEKPACGVGFIRANGPNLIVDPHGIRLDEFAKNFLSILDRPVIDKTGITGSFDLHLEFAPDDSTPGVQLGPSDTPSGASIFTAMQEQLGLKLESDRGPGEFLVIDSIERPSEN